PPSSYPEKLLRIIDCYYSAKESSIRAYFERIGYTGVRPSNRRVEKLLSEGFRPGEGNHLIFNAMRNKYAAWKRGLRSAQEAPGELSGWRCGRDSWIVNRRE